MTGLERTAATTAIYRTRRTWARPPPDTAAAVQAPAVTVKWRQSGQGGNLFAIEHSQLGQVGEQSTREHFADPGNGAQQLVALAPKGSLANRLGEFIVEAGKSRAKPLERWPGDSSPPSASRPTGAAG
jgi:hypothetical protein